MDWPAWAVVLLALGSGCVSGPPGALPPGGTHPEPSLAELLRNDTVMPCTQWFANTPVDPIALEERLPPAYPRPTIDQNAMSGIQLHVWDCLPAWEPLGVRIGVVNAMYSASFSGAGAGSTTQSYAFEILSDSAALRQALATFGLEVAAADFMNDPLDAPEAFRVVSGHVIYEGASMVGPLEPHPFPLSRGWEYRSGDSPGGPALYLAQGTDLMLYGWDVDVEESDAISRLTADGGELGALTLLDSGEGRMFIAQGSGILGVHGAPAP